jgi:SAM-dependent methyltransferase
MLNDESARLAYRLAAGRWPRDGEEQDWRGHLATLKRDPETLVEALLHLHGLVLRSALAELEPYRALPLSTELERAARLDRARFDQLYGALMAPGRELIIGQAEYLPAHRARFWETFNACDLFLTGRTAPRVLEFGTSELTALYKPLFPDLTLDLSDRPTPPGFVGFTEEAAKRISGCDAYYALDLENREPRAGGAGPPNGAYDLVLLAEVLEHLVVNPVELLRDLCALLKPDGVLYLTTPNFFRRENLEKIALRENPQPPYPPAGDNWDRHYHYREYAAPELLRFIREAGGDVIAFYFSACWDTDPDIPPEERGNLVFAVRRARARP